MSKLFLFVSLISLLLNTTLDFQQSDAASAQCDAAYPAVCIPSPPPDLDCPDVGFKNFKVLPPDPHHFDRDNDGVGCES